jgi:tetratricopeptide (TPR) repeat protein
MPKKAKPTEILDPDALYQKAKDLVNATQPTPALTAINKALKARPKWPEAYFVRGLVRLQQGDFYKAADDFDNALKYRPDFPDATIKLGQTYLMLQNYPMAERIFSDQLKRADSADARLGRGLAFMGMQRSKQALVDMDEAIRLKPDFAEAWFARGDYYLLHQEYAKALTQFSEAIRLNPTLPGFYLQRARVYIAMGNYDQALTDFDHVLAAMPDPMLYIERGDINYQRGAYQAAADDYQHYLDLGGDENGPPPQRVARLVFQLKMRAASEESRYQSRRWF